MKLKTLILSSLFAAHSTMALSHEFWLEPEVYQAKPGETVGIHLRNGEDFEGIDLSWFDPRVESTTLILDGESSEYKGLPGDLPAITVTIPDAPLTIAYQSKMSRLTYDSWEKVLRFADHKGASWFEKAHSDRGLPQENATEAYWRYSKTVLGPHGAEYHPQTAGLETEFVLQSNPFTDVPNNVQLILLYQGAPRPHARVEIWEKSPDAVTKSQMDTDATGWITLPVKPGHSYQVDSVVIREPIHPTAIEAGVMWESHWANLTFAIPGE